MLMLPLLLIAFILAACGPQVVPVPETPAGEPPVVSQPLPQTEELPAGVEAARQALAARLGIPAEQIIIVTYEPIDWPDGCLGLGGPAESCLAAITPGYAVTLETGGEQYAYRTNLEGTAVREDLFQASSAAVDMARLALAERLGITIDQVTVVSQVPVEWPDSCLGLPAEDELCAMMITPGYEITLQAAGEVQVFHTNEDGSSVRQAPGGTPAPEAMRDILARRLGVSLSQIEPVSAERVEWSDACLGVHLPDVMCAEVITPGYQLVYVISGEEYVLHTNLDLSAFALASAPVPSAEDAVVVWEERDFGCSMILISDKSLAYGPCDGELIPALFADFERVEEFNYFLETYAPFEGETGSGVVTFRGEGQQEAGEVEQRALVEWARQIFIELREGRSDPPADRVLEWHRQGGFAGFCDILRVNASGFAVVENCKAMEPSKIGMAFLSTEQLQQVYEWRDTFLPFELEEKDDAVTDAMTIRLVFNGNGARPASEQDQRAMLDLANQLFNQTVMGR
jgi:hypothetical protein